MGTGLIFAAVVAVWVAYFVPLALRRYDEAARNGSVDRFSGAMRVLAHREDTDDTGHEERPERAEVAPRPAATRETARIAARRRRRTLLTLLFAVAVVGALSAFAVLPVWSPAVPGALVVAWLVACRIQVRVESGAGAARRESRESKRAARAKKKEAHDEDRAARQAERQQRRAERENARAERERKRAEREELSARAEQQDLFARQDSSSRRDSFPGDDEATVVLAAQDDYDPHRKHVMERAPLAEEDLLEVEVSAVPVSSPTGATLWDPVPVTLPTYVGKPRAARTIRTIDFGEPGAWTGGHVEGEDTEIARPAAEREHRRAVGD